MISLISVTLSSTFIHRCNELYANGQSVGDIVDVLNLEYANALAMIGSSVRITNHDIERAIRMEQDNASSWYDMLDMLHDWLAARAEDTGSKDLNQEVALEFIEWASSANLSHFLVDGNGKEVTPNIVLEAMEAMQSVLSHETFLTHKWVGGGRETAVRELIARLPVTMHPSFLKECTQLNVTFKGDMKFILQDLNGRWKSVIDSLGCGQITEADFTRSLELMRRNYTYDSVTLIFHWLKHWLPLHAPNRKWSKDLGLKIENSRQHAIRMEHLDQRARRQLEDQFNLFVTWLMLHNNVRYVTPAPEETMNISELRDLFFGIKAAIIYASKLKRN